MTTTRLKSNDTATDTAEKLVIYQVFTRLFGNTNTTNKPWGTIEENGSGKFSDFSEKALDEISALGANWIWYTGVPHHASVTDYSAYGIAGDDPDVVKGRAGSPYAVRDYYNVDPDLADDPASRLEEFEALISRTHAAGLKVMIDIVPNHVARQYYSVVRPQSSFGARDDTSVTYSKNNNFYYIPGEPFEVPDFTPATKPLGGASHPLADGHFDESPALWTGNGSRNAKPDVNDWYETVKINYGVTPSGDHEFPDVPEELRFAPAQAHYQYWSDKVVPDSWVKFKDITQYWLDKGVDGFRYDMAEMVPVAFWSYLNSHIKHTSADAVLLAEVYQPALYRDYLQLGKMDYLYDKVDFYDSLKDVMQNNGDVAKLADIQEQYGDIRQHLLHFLENHDEQRIASPEFAGNAESGKPALVVSALISESPVLIYFGQENGEDGSEVAGFGQPSRTSIFDYIGVPAHQRWMNNGKFDGGQSTGAEQALRDYYKTVLNIAASTPAVISGNYQSLHQSLKVNGQLSDAKVFAFVRWNNDDILISVSNFYSEKEVLAELDLSELPAEFSDLRELEDKLTGARVKSEVKDGKRSISFKLSPNQSVILTM